MCVWNDDKAHIHENCFIVFTAKYLNLIMDIQTEKLSLIKWLTEVTEPSIIAKFTALKNDQTIDWWDQISEDEKAEIAEGIADIEKGNVSSHEEVMAKYQKWRSK